MSVYRKLGVHRATFYENVRTWRNTNLDRNPRRVRPASAPNDQTEHCDRQSQRQDPNQTPRKPFIATPITLTISLFSLLSYRSKLRPVRLVRDAIPLLLLPRPKRARITPHGGRDGRMERGVRGTRVGRGDDRRRHRVIAAIGVPRRARARHVRLLRRRVRIGTGLDHFFVNA